MNNQIFRYLQNKNITEESIINRLFISAFIKKRNLIVKKNKLLLANYITEQSKEYDLLIDFTNQLIQNECSFEIEDLIKLFEFVISPSDRKINGSVYTPSYIRDRIVKESLIKFYNKKNINSIVFADISCGCGSFLLDIAKFLHTEHKIKFVDIFKKNIIGIDIQNFSINRSKLLLSYLALTFNEDENFKFNLIHGDSLTYNFANLPKIDIIVGNPPYVGSKNLTDKTREKMKKWFVCRSGNTDLYIPFFQIAIEILTEGGILCYITMNSFLGSLNGKCLRQYLLNKKFDVYIIDFRGTQIFKSKYTYTCLFLLKKVYSNDIKYCVNSSCELPKNFIYHDIPYNLLSNKTSWKLNNFHFINKIESVGKPLRLFCKSRHGIATLSNNIFIFKPIKKTRKYYLFDKNDIVHRVEIAICRKIINSNRLNTKTDISQITEQVIFPYYESSDGKAKLLSEETLKKRFPYAYEYLNFNKNILTKRDNGKILQYTEWFAFGRTQSLILPKYKLFIPKLANKPIESFLSDDDLLLYNGLCFVNNDLNQIKIVKCIIESDIFWQYITMNGKPYVSNYYALNGENMNNFGIPIFSNNEISYLLQLKSKHEINKFLSTFYQF